MADHVGFIVLAFASGAIYESGCVFWVHYCEKKMARPAVMWSGINATMTIIGVESFLNGYDLKVAYVAGFMTGTRIALAIKHRLSMTEAISVG